MYLKCHFKKVEGHTSPGSHFLHFFVPEATMLNKMLPNKVQMKNNNTVFLSKFGFDGFSNSVFPNRWDAYRCWYGKHVVTGQKYLVKEKKRKKGKKEGRKK